MKAAIEMLRRAHSRELARLRCLAADLRRVRRPGTRPTLVAAYEADLREGLAKRHDLNRAIALLEAAPVVLALVRAADAVVQAADACDREAERHPSSRSSAPVVRSINAMRALRGAIADPLVQKLIAEGE
jgi:hypothetical protein